MKTTRNDAVTGYKLDFASNTLTLTFKFHHALSDYGSPEYNRYQAIMADFPNLKVSVKAGRDIKTTRKTKRLTYKNMETYMKCFDNSKELLARFDLVKQQSAPLASPYKYVRDWFELQFPNYKDAPVFQEDDNGKDKKKKSAVLPVDAPNPDDYKQKDEAA